MEINRSILDKYEEEGLLRSQVHPLYPNLRIYNYTEKVQFENLWDDLTLRCRGMVVDLDTGKVVARPFKKFFNIEENKHTPTEKFKVYEKLDGSLGILFKYNGEWIWATRGSFTSEQSIKAKEIFEKKYTYKNLNEYVTYMFEIIYPDNRIVVDYQGEEKVILLGGNYTEYNVETSLTRLKRKGFEVVQEIKGVKDYKTLKEKVEHNKEGYVVKFSNKDRCKVKGENYIRLHKVITNISTRSVWTALKNGDDMYKLLEDVPDEFYQKIDQYIRELNSKFRLLKNHYCYVFYHISQIIDISDRRKFAKKAKKYSHPGILFKLLDKKDINQLIWKLIEPEYKLL